MYTGSIVRMLRSTSHDTERNHDGLIGDFGLSESARLFPETPITVNCKLMILIVCPMARWGVMKSVLASFSVSIATRSLKATSLASNARPSQNDQVTNFCILFIGPDDSDVALAAVHYDPVISRHHTGCSNDLVPKRVSDCLEIRKLHESADAWAEFCPPTS